MVGTSAGGSRSDKAENISFRDAAVGGGVIREPWGGVGKAIGGERRAMGANGKGAVKTSEVSGSVRDWML